MTLRNYRKCHFWYCLTENLGFVYFSVLSCWRLKRALLSQLLSRQSKTEAKSNNTLTVQAESSKFASVLFDQEFQIWVDWNWLERHLLVFCIDPIVPGFVVYYVNLSKFRQNSKQNTNSREILDSNDDKLLLQNGIQRRRKTEANNLESLSTGPEAGVWSLVTNKKSERKMNLLLFSVFFFKKLVSMI